jgi:ABC-type multidrug transport system fused ATPase/permease subunit
VARQLDLDASSFGTAAILAVRSLQFLQQLNASNEQYAEVAPYLDEIHEAIDEHAERARPRGQRTIDAVRELELDGVEFSYGELPAIRDVSLRVEHGTWLGVVGPSGSGKTTLANVLAGLLRPTRGAYRVNGIDAEDIDADSWASRFAVLSQEPVLTRGSIADNISFYREASGEAVADAARRAAIADDIEKMPLGWETPVGEGESSLSGGQRQRLALARSLLEHPSVLILDEPTSALDAESERLVEQSLRSLDPDTIVIVVSHRPTLLSRCTRFAIVEAGSVTVIDHRDEALISRYVGAYK